MRLSSDSIVIDGVLESVLRNDCLEWGVCRIDRNCGSSKIRVSDSPSSGSIGLSFSLYLVFKVLSSRGNTVYPHFDMIVSMRLSMAGIVRKACKIREKSSKICLWWSGRKRSHFSFQFTRSRASSKLSKDPVGRVR